MLSQFKKLKRDNLKSRLFKNFSISFTGSMLLMIIGFVRMPLLTKNISLAEYGQIFIVANFFQVLSLFFSFRVNDLIYKFLPQFEEQKDFECISALLRFSLLTCILLGLFIFIITFWFGDWIVINLYHIPNLYNLLLVHMFASIFIPFREFSSGILRLKNRFSLIVIPEVSGGIISLLLICYLFFIYKNSDLFWIITAITIGNFVAYFLPFIISLIIVIKFIFTFQNFFSFSVLKPYQKEIFSTLFQTNLITYLKFATSEGGVFLLGVFSSPEQVAIFGFAKKLTNPILILQNNIQTALNPEIVKLYSKKLFNRLFMLIKKIVTATSVTGIVILIIALIMVKPVIMIFATEKYLAAISVFYIILPTVYVTFISLPFFYLALCMNKLGRRNLVVSFTLVYILIFSITGLNAVTLSLSHLLGAITTRLFNDIPLFREFKKKLNNQTNYDEN